MVRLSVIAAAAAALGSASAFTVPTGAPLLRPAHRAHGVRALQAQQRDDSAAGISRRETIFRAAAFGAVAATSGLPGMASAQGVISDSTALSQLSILEDAQADLFEKVVPSVCYISTEYTSMANQLNLDASQLPKGVGTGFVWDKKGHIVTNFHVINKVDNAIVTLTTPDGNQKKYTAKLTGVDPDKDIAVLKIDAPAADLNVIAIGDSLKTRVGQYSFAVGNPFGQDHTLTTGVISGKNRIITAPTGRKISGVIQTDAAINPGNSGGPLLDSRGQLIGINTASLGAGVSAGVGFAVPIALARPSIEQLIEFGQVQRAILGISYLERTPTAAEAERGGLPLVEKGIVVLEVPKGSPAEEAGMLAVQKAADPKARPVIGDVIVAINKDEIKDPLDLSTVLSKFKPNDKVDIVVKRGPEQLTKTLKVKLGAFQGAAFSKLENERGADFGKKGTPINVPLSDIAPEITPKMPSAN
jgi:S1-C subfamily serine protease